MNRRIYDEMLADLLMEEVGAEVIDEAAASEVPGLLACLIDEAAPVARPGIEIGVPTCDASWMWGGLTRH